MAKNRLKKFSNFISLVIEVMAPIGRPQVRAMFGGHGVYLNNIFIAIIADDRLYFKTDAMTLGDFEAQGMDPFTYVSRGKTLAMQYYEAPPDVFEEPEAMRVWADKAVGAALRARKINTKPRITLAVKKKK